MPDFTHVISLAYERILRRSPDPGGLDNYNRLMNEGMTEAAMRESLLRSAEYARKNPDEDPAAMAEQAIPASRKKKSSRKK